MSVIKPQYTTPENHPLERVAREKCRFAGTSVAQTAIDKAYDDISQAVTDSKVNTSDLTTIAADQAAVKAALPTIIRHAAISDTSWNCWKFSVMRVSS